MAKNSQSTDSSNPRGDAGQFTAAPVKHRPLAKLNPSQTAASERTPRGKQGTSR